MVDNKENVLEEYLEKAQNGDVDAQFKIAWAYDQGEGIEQNYVEANKWWLKAAEQGSRVAQYNIAQNLRNARGIEVSDYETAFKWYLESANKGYTKAFFRVAWAYAQGEGVEQDYVEANKWYLKAAQQGDKVAQYNIAQNLCNARGVEKPDYETAEKWYLESAKLGYEKANDRLREIQEKKRMLVNLKRTEMLEIEVDSKYVEIQNSYKKVCKTINDAVTSGNPVSKSDLQRDVKQFESVCTEYLFDEFFSTHKYFFDLLEKDKITDEEKREILLTVGKNERNEGPICNALSLLENVKYEVKEYEQIVQALNETMMQFFFSPGYGCGLYDTNISIRAGEFIKSRYVALIYAFLKDKKDIVALYSRQILNFILKDIYVSGSRRVDWPDKDIDIVKKIEMIEREGYVSKEMIGQCTSVRCHTNLGHHIVTASKWNEWDDVKCIEDTIILIYHYLKEVKKAVNLDEKQQKQVRDRLYFWKRNHNSLRFNVDDELNKYTAEQLGQSCLEERHSWAAVYGRRLLEMWMNKKFFSAYSQSSLWPEGKDNLLEGINFLYEKNIITESEKRIAHEIRKNCNGAMHIESSDDTVCSAETIKNNIRSLMWPRELSNAEIKEELRKREKEKLRLKYSTIAQEMHAREKAKETQNYIISILCKVGIAVIALLVFIMFIYSKENPNNSGNLGQHVGVQTESTEEKKEYISIYDVEISKSQIETFEKYMKPSTVSVVKEECESWSNKKKVFRYAEYNNLETERCLNIIGLTLSLRVRANDIGTYTSIYDVELTENQFEKVKSQLDEEIISMVTNELANKSMTVSNEMYIIFCALYDVEAVEKVLNETLGITLNP